MDTVPQKNGFSIVIPFHNNASTIERTLDSLNKQDTDRDVEIIPVEDHSTDSTKQKIKNHPICEKWPVRIIQKKKKGSLANAYNLGWQNAGYDKIVYMQVY